MKGIKNIVAAALCVIIAACSLVLWGGKNGESVDAYTENYHDAEAPAALLADEFSLVVFGDTQCVYEVEARQPYAVNAHNWVIDNADEINLAYTVHVGDVVNDVEDPTDSDKDAQFKRASAAMKLLDDAKIPQAIAPGNHDYLGYANSTRNLEKFDEYFPLSRYADMPGLGGSMSDTSIENTYHYFTAGGEDYLIVSLGYKPLNSTLEWACGVVEAHPDRKVIVTTHSYQYADGTRDTLGERMWRNFISKYENIFMVLCGHRIPEYGYVSAVSYGEHGNEVHEIMVNMQYFENGGAGTVFQMNFRNDDSVDAYLYNPTFDKYLNDPLYLELGRALPDTAASADTVYGGSITGDYTVDFSAAADTWTEKAYASQNAAVSGDMLHAVNTSAPASVTYRLQAGEGSVFTGMTLSATAALSEGEELLIYASPDGKTFNIVKRFGSGDTACSVNLYNYAWNRGELYVKAVFLTASGGVSALKLETQGKRVVDSAMGDLEISHDFTGKADYDTTTWAAEAVEAYDLLVFGGYLGTGRESNYAGAEGHLIYNLSAGGKVFETLTVRLTGRLTGTDMGYAVRIFLSTDNGATYTKYAEEKVTVNNYSGAYDLSAYVKGKDAVMLKICLYGNFWHTVGLTSMRISGTYRYVLDYDYGGGTVGAANPETVLLTDTPKELNPPAAREYYDFDGWYADAEFSRRVQSVPDGLTGGGTLYAKWSETLYGITYELNGGKFPSGITPPKTISHFDSADTVTPTRTGYTFGGWYADAGLTEPVTELSGLVQDITLHAKWLKNYRLTYVLNGGEMGDKRDSFTVEDSFDFGTPEREGYTFAGWYTDETLTESISGITPGRTENLIIYAKWTATGGGGGGGCKSSVSGAAGIMLCGLLCLCAAAVHRKRLASGMKITDRNE